MKGSVQLNKGKFYPVLYDKETKKHKWGIGCQTRREAEKELRIMLAKYDGGSIVFGKTDTFELIYQQWSEEVLPEVSKSRNNRETAKNQIENHVIPVIGKIAIDKINTQALQRMFAEMRKKPTKEELTNNINPEKLSAATKHKIMGYINGIFTYAMELGQIVENPAAGVKLQSAPMPDLAVWNANQLFTFLEWCRLNLPHYYYLAFLILGTTAMRRGEACGLKYADIRGNLIIQQHAVDRYGNVTDMKTSGSHRPTALMHPVLSAIAEQKRRQASIIQEIGNFSGIQGSVKPWDYILTDEWNKPIMPDILTKNFRKAVIRYRKEVDDTLPYIPLKNLRHTFATIALTSGEYIGDVSAQLGHSRKSTTLDRYSQFISNPAIDMSQRMQDRLFGKADCAKLQEKNG